MCTRKRVHSSNSPACLDLGEKEKELIEAAKVMAQEVPMVFVRHILGSRRGYFQRLSDEHEGSATFCDLKQRDNGLVDILLAFIFIILAFVLGYFMGWE